VGDDLVRAKASVVVAKVAVAVGSSATVPMTVAPSLNCTSPWGISVPDQLTVAVKVTDVPLAEGFAEDAMLVVVSALFTVCVTLPVLVA
jgi:hypothetical protein